jgi:uncharacterized membrane protein
MLRFDSLYPVGDEKQTHTPHDALSFLFTVVVDPSNVYFCQKKWRKLKKHLPDMVSMSKYG